MRNFYRLLFFPVLISALFFCCIQVTFSQSTNDTSDAKYFPGYIRTTHGGGFSYHSPHPEVRQSMLLRSVSASDYIEWETFTVPSDYDRQFINFIWLYGIDVSPDSHKYTLFLNGDTALAFSNPLVTDTAVLVVQGKDGIMLTFRPSMVDKYDDLMGFAILQVPAGKLVKGKTQKIKVTSEGAGSRVWYMTFEKEVKNEIRYYRYDALIKEDSGVYTLSGFHIFHTGKPGGIHIDIEGMDKISANLKTGYNQVSLKTREVLEPRTCKTNIRYDDGQELVMYIKLEPVKKWTVYLVQHAHTDIGYTRPQTEILPEHLRFIDFALDYCDLTDHYPDDARFRWTCETAWPVREYIRVRPARQVTRLKDRIKEGRIEVTGMMLNMSEMYEENILANQCRTIGSFREAGMDVVTAMQNDVNGVPWCMIDYLSGCGVKYLTMGQNTHRAHKPFDIPTVFRWKSPSGNSILAYRNEHYMTGNMLGMNNSNPELFTNELMRFLKNLEEKGYRHDKISLQFSGYLTDNSPPSIIACELVKNWNEKFLWPKLRLATASEFMEQMEQSGLSFPEYQQAWPDWWSDGFGSTALETAFARKTHADFTASTGLLAMAKLCGSVPSEAVTDKIALISDDLIFWNEHTFTAAESISDPLCENTVVQWNEKRAFVWDAVKQNRLLREAAMGLLQDFIPSCSRNSIAVFNTLNRQRSGMFEIYADHEMIPNDRKFTLLDDDNNPVPMQKLSSRDDGTYWAGYVKDLPSFGFKTLRIDALDEPASQQVQVRFSGLLENNYYKIEFDTLSGTIKSIYDKELGAELTDHSGEWKFGQFIYERLGKNRAQLEQLRLDDYTRVTWSGVKHGKVTEGPVWTSIRFTGYQEECADSQGIHMEVRLYNTEKRIELHYSMKKKPVYDPEAVYIAMPFGIENAKLRFDVQGGIVEPGVNQIEGSSADWNVVQNFISVTNQDQQVVLVSPEIPMVHFGEINMGKFMRKNDVKKPHVFSWVLNNYWTTNFLASQEGELKWHYIISSSNKPSDASATWSSWSSRVPIPARLIPAKLNSPETVTSKSWMNPAIDGLLLVNAGLSVDNKAVLLQFREIDGKRKEVQTADFFPGGGEMTFTEVNAAGEKVRDIKESIIFEALEVKFILVENGGK